MRLLKSHPLLKLFNSYLFDGSQPSNLNFAWNFGSLLAVCLIIQLVTGVTLGMHYNGSISQAFDSVEHVMRDVNNGWLIRYFHSNTASAFFFLVKFFIITNLMSAIPWLGQDIVEFIWGGFSVNNATLNRFFALHFLLPFVLAILVLLHLITLHETGGSGNPIGSSSNSSRVNMSPYYLFKDLITLYIFIWVLSFFVYFMPNFLGDSENYVPANPMQTPAAIVPEWYLLSFYAILRSIPNKLLGVLAMFGAILAILTLPYFDVSKLRGFQFKPTAKFMFWMFVANFVILIVLGAKHVESPFIVVGQCMTFLYFIWYINFIPTTSLFEDLLSTVELNKNNSKSASSDQLSSSSIFSIAWEGNRNNLFERLNILQIKLFNILNNIILVLEVYLKFIIRLIIYLVNKLIILLKKLWSNKEQIYLYAVTPRVTEMLDRIEEKDKDRDMINRIHANAQDEASEDPNAETSETEDCALYLLEKADSCQEKNVDKLREAARTVSDREAIIDRAQDMIDPDVADALLEVANNMFNGGGGG
uniref:apocytochrome b n=1 Tax=Drechslerella dactyloides TaxID=74499 RepID=UPI0022FD7D3D|nr:apocytochrome b [Drechslerella dactyloides]WAN89817.1 apocytochrome b [Drechslerella dactyloides]